MANIRQLASGRWQATVRLPDGRRSAVRATQSEARNWVSDTENIAGQPAEAASEATFAWAPDGLDIHIPDSQITMDLKVELEQTLRQVLGAEV